MEQLQAPPGTHLRHEPATGGFGAGVGPAPTTAAESPPRSRSPRFTGGSGTEGRTVSKSREPRAESREPRAESREPSSCPSPGRAVPPAEFRVPPLAA